MTIHRLTEPCWVLDPMPPGDNGDAHYDDRPSAAKALREAREEGFTGKETATVSSASTRKTNATCPIVKRALSLRK
jgi:hypothetical protein